MSIFFGIPESPSRDYKGKSLLSLIDDYVVIDLETTGLMPQFDDIIEIGAIKYEGNKEIARFHSFVSIDRPLSSFVTRLTGITDEMLKGAPTIEQILPEFLNFISDSILVAHNANFDINFIYDESDRLFDRRFTNQFIDTLRLARRCALPVENNKLKTLIKHFGISQKVSHRAMDDCEATYLLYNRLKEYIKENNVCLSPKPSVSYRVADTVANSDVVDTDNPFYGKVVAFTGTLESMPRKDAAQIVANMGGVLNDGVNKKNNYLVLGNFDYCSSIKDGKSSKHKRAEELILKGQDLEIIPETVFLSMITEQ